MKGTILCLVMLLLQGSFSSAVAQTKILLEDAPAAVQSLVAEKYRKYKVAGVKQKNGKQEFSIELEKGERTVSLELDSVGNILSKTKGRIYSYDGTEPPPTKGVPHNERDGYED